VARHQLNTARQLHFLTNPDPDPCAGGVRAHSPKYHLVAPFDTKVWDATATLVISVETVQRGSGVVGAVGFAVLELFVDEATGEGCTSAPFTSHCVLNEGHFQVYQSGPLAHPSHRSRVNSGQRFNGGLDRAAHVAC
jgi:hypothetical protein